MRYTYVCLSLYFTYSSAKLSNHMFTWIRTHAMSILYIYQFVYQSVIYMSVYLSQYIYIYIYLCTYLSTYQLIYLSIYLNTCLSIYIYICIYTLIRTHILHSIHEYTYDAFHYQMHICSTL